MEPYYVDAEEAAKAGCVDGCYVMGPDEIIDGVGPFDTEEDAQNWNNGNEPPAAPAVPNPF